ncbi:RHS repeat-associated core domain-containing protein [Muricauda sp. SCSIO 64092]|uniref:RHS repeat-associated core domain-containing protein n=1 Tax=Allomuricauda sp. SCSIO 64092 TaxID=2908842 RepID=UPI001FF4A217|nr:RHS repeat-associated core domain-containing protein [Muricauda sp. SCSIO 64092]UOY08641.1 RHS repeat-associated core domain-containing protein [Muricauda sp. SCSIO 64092]
MHQHANIAQKNKEPRAIFQKSGSTTINEDYNDYYPFGMVMPGRNSVDANNYRYGYQGQYAETDPETGKPAFELRLWDSRIGRWLSPDPYGQFHSPYLGMGNNPIAYTDPDGGCIKNGEPCNASRTGERVVGDGGAVWEWDGDTWGLHESYAIQLEGVTMTQNGAYGFRDWQSDMQDFRALQFEQMAAQHRADHARGVREYSEGALTFIQVATLPISIAELAFGGAALLANSRNGALLVDDATTVFTHGADDVLYTRYQNLGNAGRSVFNFADEVGYAAHQIKPSSITGPVLNFGKGAVDATFHTSLNAAPVLYQAPSAFRVSLAASNAMFAPYAYYLRHTSSIKR